MPKEPPQPTRSIAEDAKGKGIGAVSKEPKVGVKAMVNVPPPPPPPVRLGRWRGKEGQSIGSQPPAPMELVPPGGKA